MSTYTFQPVLVIDVASGLRAQNETGSFLDTAGGTPQAITDLAGGALDGLDSNSDGITPSFQSGLPWGFLVFGTITLPIVSIEAFQAAVEAAEALSQGGTGNMISVYKKADGTWPARPSSTPPPQVTAYWIGPPPAPIVGTDAVQGDIYLQTS